MHLIDCSLSRFPCVTFVFLEHFVACLSFSTRYCAAVLFCIFNMKFKKIVLFLKIFIDICVETKKVITSVVQKRVKNIQFYNKNVSVFTFHNIKMAAKFVFVEPQKCNFDQKYREIIMPPNFHPIKYLVHQS